MSDSKTMALEAISYRLEQGVCFIDFHCPDKKNVITLAMLNNIKQVLAQHESHIKVLVLGHHGDTFCQGADLSDVAAQHASPSSVTAHPELLYELWLAIANGSFISIAHVQGVANAGGIGFVAACDFVISNETSTFSLSELLFGLFPACVMPFLIHKIGAHKANKLCLSTRPIKAQDAKDIGLVDILDSNSERALKLELRRIAYMPISGIQAYKNYKKQLMPMLEDAQAIAVQANREIFSDADNLQRITHFLKTGEFSNV